MQYVYLLRSKVEPDQFYTGLTVDLRQRLAEHNNGSSPHTAKFKPWALITYIAFDDSTRAVAFEQYMKTGSGREFARRHFR